MTNSLEGVLAMLTRGWRDLLFTATYSNGMHMVSERIHQCELQKYVQFSNITNLYSKCCALTILKSNRKLENNVHFVKFICYDIMKYPLLWHVQSSFTITSLLLTCIKSLCYDMYESHLLWHVWMSFAMTCMKSLLLWHYGVPFDLTCMSPICYDMHGVLFCYGMYSLLLWHV